jgi:hypothetical protein
MAGLLLGSIPTLLVYLFTARVSIRGMMAGAIADQSSSFSAVRCGSHHSRVPEWVMPVDPARNATR